MSGRLNIPGDVQGQSLLEADKGGEDADDETGGDQHDDHPDVELDGGPVVAVDAGDAALVDERAARRGGGSHGVCVKRA